MRSVRRAADGVYVTTAARTRLDAETRRERFDTVVLACHSDQALRFLGEGTSVEREVLGALRYQPNDVVVHTDARVMLRRRRAWAARDPSRLRLVAMDDFGPHYARTLRLWRDALRTRGADGYASDLTSAVQEANRLVGR